MQSHLNSRFKKNEITIIVKKLKLFLFRLNHYSCHSLENENEHLINTNNHS